MNLLQLRNIQLSFGSAPLLDGVDLGIESGERLCLVGRNGSGKSTLTKLVAAELQADDGELSRRDGLRVARLTQEVPHGLEGSVFDVVADGLGEVGEVVRRYHHLSEQLALSASDETIDTQALLDELESVQHRLEAAGGWTLTQRVEAELSRTQLDGSVPFDSLSGGLKRRTLLARALVTEPDLLILDEPTNHLDIAAIDWLESFLLEWNGTLLFITHDRAFLQRLATRIIELDRGTLSSWPGDYATYLRRKEEQLESEARANALFDKKLAQEEVWIRQGIKARRTRNEGRVRALKALREERSERRELIGKAKIQANVGDQSGKRVVEAEGVSYRYAPDQPPVIQALEATILRGDKVGIIGPNGCGKSTLLKLLLGQITPDAGEIKIGTNIQIAYFDQHRAALDDTISALDNIAEGRERIPINGSERHVMGYLQDFLFSPERARAPIRSLSGGERNRLLLAKLFTRPANLLVLDEPTNDLDVETLELLEELLTEFQGTVLVVSHDRAFLNNVVTSTLVYEGDRRFVEYVGGYDDWLRQRPAQRSTTTSRADPSEKKAKSEPAANKSASTPAAKSTLDKKEKRELENLPKKIEKLEEEQETLHATMAEEGFFERPQAEIDRINARLNEIQNTLESSYARWEELEEMG